MDTFPAFLRYWKTVQGDPLEEQIKRWAAEYLSPWRELLELQIEDYRSQQIDWREIARKKIFPFLEEQLPAMQDAHQNLLELAPPLYRRTQKVLGFNMQASFIIYVGIGCGAGWVTTYQNTPAILFGLENIAGLGWSSQDPISGLIAHESGHLAHRAIRTEAGKAMGSGAWWQLYEEGFAQYCEPLILGLEHWHQAHDNPDWLAWCRENESGLAAAFLQTVQEGDTVRPFFGSWFDIQGKSAAGYYLGYRVIQELKKRIPLKELACLENPHVQLQPVLEVLAKENGKLLPV